jgi:tetratricopeptide (TPR) repeat protein
MVDGHRVEGRYVAGEAYAAYLRGVVLETEGRLDAAMAAFGEAIRHDPDSAELWTRLGALRCAAEVEPTSAASGSTPWDAFKRASEIDPAYEETWTERARCHLRRNDLDSAAQAARTAVSLDPNRVETAILLALVLERQGKLEDARRWLDGLLAVHETSIEAHDAMVAFAARTHDDARRQASTDALDALRPPRSDGRAPRPNSVSLSEVDAAIVGGSFDRAKRLAFAARLSSGRLALRAAALGSVSFASAQAELVLAADPTSTDARIAAAVAADLARDDAALARALNGVRTEPTSLSPLGVLLMRELLYRRLGSAAADAWIGASGPAITIDDELARAVERRLLADEERT